jgi:Thioesterase-like superfamily
LVYLFANLKSLPFAWHIRVLYHLIANTSRKPVPPESLSSLPNDVKPSSRRILTHPLFAPTQLSTLTPILETDYNLHKSNSTYFSDLDVSRTQLMTRLFSPAFRKVNAQLGKEGYKGRMVVALGAVHMSFRREIGIYERVWVRSRVLGWDEKWAVVVSYFVRTKRGAGNEEELCATGLSKYVVKKGRFTVKPERIFATAGWLPVNPENKQEQHGTERKDLVDSAEIPAEINHREEKCSGIGIEGGDTDGGLESTVQNLQSALNVVLDEESAAGAVRSTSELLLSETRKTAWNADAWSWDEIEEERRRGMALAKGWLALDGELRTEFETN